MYYTTTYPSPLGTLTLAAEDDRLVGLWFEGQTKGDPLLQAAVPAECLPVFIAAGDWLDRYFAGRAPAPAELPLAPKGTSFRQQVWRLLRDIPYGEMTTYGALAGQVAALPGKDRMAAQAVGGAVGQNPLPIIIPCHRVIGAGGNLTGYAGGLEIKIRLLEHEGVDLSRLFLPAGGSAR
ncbi:MAG: methylated-DNA--[protein]-cysteine S-methyltransferase [Eubacteriales bacterium]